MVLDLKTTRKRLKGWSSLLTAALGLRPCQLQAAVWHCIQCTALAEGWEGTRPGTGLVDEDAAPF